MGWGQASTLKARGIRRSGENIIFDGKKKQYNAQIIAHNEWKAKSVCDRPITHPPSPRKCTDAERELIRPIEKQSDCLMMARHLEA